MKANHIIAIRKTVRFEGGYVNDPADPGGETKFGISKRQYPDITIRNLTMEEVFNIYKHDYWDKLSLDECESQVIANEVFDTAVNMGVKKAAKMLQEAINMINNAELVVDGIIGPVTMRNLNASLWMAGKNSHGRESLLLKFLDGLQFMHYWNITEENPRMKRFLKGWVNHRIGNEEV